MEDGPKSRFPTRTPRQKDRRDGFTPALPSTYISSVVIGRMKVQAVLQIGHRIHLLGTLTCWYASDACNVLPFCFDKSLVVLWFGHNISLLDWFPSHPRQFRAPTRLPPFIVPRRCALAYLGYWIRVLLPYYEPFSIVVRLDSFSTTPLNKSRLSTFKTPAAQSRTDNCQSTPPV